MPPRIVMKAARRKPVKKPEASTAVTSPGVPQSAGPSMAAGPSGSRDLGQQQVNTTGGTTAPLQRPPGVTPYVKYKSVPPIVKTGGPVCAKKVPRTEGANPTPDAPAKKIKRTEGVNPPPEAPAKKIPRTAGANLKPGAPAKKTPTTVASTSRTGAPSKVNEKEPQTGRRTGGKIPTKRTSGDPAAKKPYRYRAGTVALRAVSRSDNIDDDVLADPDFVVPDLFDADVQDSRETRMSRMKFLKSAKSLEPLALDHDPDEESFPYYTFFLACYNEGARLFKLVHNTVMISAQGSWYAMIVRHAGDASKQASIRRSAEKNGGIPLMFWQKGTATVSTAVMDMRRYRTDFKKPIAVFMGEQHVTTGAGHAVVVIMYYDNGEWKAIMKDCLPYKEMGAYALSMSFLKELGFTEVLLVSELEREEHILRTCCVKESFVYSASVMEGIFPSELLGHGLENRQKHYNITCKKYL